jgi:hypothetical protein
MPAEEWEKRDAAAWRFQVLGGTILDQGLLLISILAINPA